MTYADDEFIPAGGQEENRSYPTAFGITFTPRVGGIIFGVLGLLGAIYLGVNAVQPAWQRYQELDEDIKGKQAQLQQKQKVQQEIRETQAKLEQAKQQNREVLNLFANEKSLDTLLLDLNSFVKSRNGKMVSFVPEKQAPNQAQSKDAAAIPGNGKLKRTTVNVVFEGSFDQIQSILRSFERLQSLVILRDFQARLEDDQGLVINTNTGKSVPAVFKKDDNNKVIPGGKPTIKTTFKLDVLSPVTEEEAQGKEATPQPVKQTKK